MSRLQPKTVLKKDNDWLEPKYLHNGILQIAVIYWELL